MRVVAKPKVAQPAALSNIRRGPPLPKRKKSQYGNRRKKNSKTQREWDIAVAHNNPALDDANPALDDPMVLDDDPAQPLVDVIFHTKKKARSDGNWRTNRAVEARERKIEKERKKTADAKKLAGEKLAKEKKKTATAVQKAAKEKEKTAVAKEKLQSEKKKRVTAEKKVCYL